MGVPQEKAAELAAEAVGKSGEFRKIVWAAARAQRAALDEMMQIVGFPDGGNHPTTPTAPSTTPRLTKAQMDAVKKECVARLGRKELTRASWDYLVGIAKAKGKRVDDRLINSLTDTECAELAALEGIDVQALR